MEWPNVHAPFRALARLFAAIAFIIGLASAPDDVKRWYQWLEHGVPWWVLLLAAITLFLLAQMPSIRGWYMRRRDRRPTPAPPKTKNEELSEELTAMTKKIFGVDDETRLHSCLSKLEDAEAQNETLREEGRKLGNQVLSLEDRVAALQNAVTERDREVASRDAILHQHQGEFEQFRTELRSREEILWYGERLERFAPLSESDYSVMVSRVGELRACVDALFAASLQLWSRVSGWSELREDRESASYWPARLLNEKVFLPLQNAVRAYNEVLENNPQQDPRPYLLVVYKKHEKVRLWIDHLAKTQGIPVTEAKYTAWLQAKGEFEKALREKCGAPQLRELRLAIEAHQKKLRTIPEDELLFVR